MTEQFASVERRKPERLDRKTRPALLAPVVLISDYRIANDHFITYTRRHYLPKVIAPKGGDHGRVQTRLGPVLNSPHEGAMLVRPNRGPQARECRTAARHFLVMRGLVCCGPFVCHVETTETCKKISYLILANKMDSAQYFILFHCNECNFHGLRADGQSSRSRGYTKRSAVEESTVTLNNALEYRTNCL